MMMVLIIFVINIVYVTLSTIRLILTLKGYRYLAALISMIEIVVYVVGLGLVLDRLDEIENLVAYALGFASGVVIGSKIEDKLALGYIMVNVISLDENNDLADKLRDDGYGVTVLDARGREGARLAMQILSPRKKELQLFARIKEIDSKAFIIAYEPKTIHGGFWVKRVRKGKLFK